MLWMLRDAAKASYEIIRGCCGDAVDIARSRLGIGCCSGMLKVLRSYTMDAGHKYKSFGVICGAVTLHMAYLRHIRTDRKSKIERCATDLQ